MAAITVVLSRIRIFRRAAHAFQCISVRPISGPRIASIPFSVNGGLHRPFAMQ